MRLLIWCLCSFREKTSGPGGQLHHSPGEAMASATATQKMREEATCSICLSLMTEPQSISCGHSFCQRCLEGFLDNHGHQQPNLRQHPCPQCRAPFNRTSLRPNKQLGSLIEAMKKLDLEMMCKEDGEKLHLFCEDDGQLICWRCERSPQYKGHDTALVEDACPGYKELLQEAVSNLRELEKECRNQNMFVTKQIAEWNRKVELHRQKIQDDFKNLQSFLREEEKSFLWRLEKENEQTLKVLRDSEASLKQKRRELNRQIQDLEDRCQGSAQKLLQVRLSTRKKERRGSVPERWRGQWTPFIIRKVELHRQKIQDDFKNLQSFLREEEKSFLWRLEKENEQTLKVLRDSEASLKQKRRELNRQIQDLEDRCQGSAQKLLQGVKGALSRSSAVKLDTPEAPSLQIQTVCDVSELYFDVRQLLRGYQVNVTLDPETAHCALILSEDQRHVTWGSPQRDVHNSPRRFTAYPCVLGHEGFASGRHYFEVYVGEGIQWELGVCMENVQRDIRTRLIPQSGFWAISLSTKASFSALTCPPTSLHLREQLLLVGVFLDYEAGVVSFYNMTSASHIFTFPRASFSGTLRPFIYVYPTSPLSLRPPDE
ncbi:PREDICTED: E3 ubiquitin-protein ligase TRIM38-like [Hipposideros armiger]|uniref:E3 ubiquitin-protein ligase TRIM38-like n=1 Tax=Hipposideros armiger TaxID=186990 RepID=A0A8B7QM10_HIPAR|nr:PREDICTED: E3 ubiquitin-protein ligase TRIM38-like [Hipposideros armiger]